MKHVKIVFFSLLLSIFAFSVHAQEVKEHPLIRPFPGSVLAKNMSKYQKFNAYDFEYMNKETNKREKKQVKGEYYYLLYEVRTESGDRVRDISKVEFHENYKAAALEKGGEVVYEDPRGHMVFTIPRDDGGLTWCKVAVTANLGQQYLVIVDEKGFEKSLTFGPAEMKAALDKDGRVQLYGILFDVDKATLKEESVKQLQHVVTLMKDNPELVLEVQGHTDDQGSDDYNMKLSQQRAETVVTYLGLFGIDAGRLAPKGYGESTPVAPNTTEEGRAKNRRVELVKT
ncbi:MAG: OmpA family protein [Desulfomonilia bacterium]|nr:OmpA family protein [Desulfomonilia bacterium]